MRELFQDQSWVFKLLSYVSAIRKEKSVALKHTSLYIRLQADVLARLTGMNALSDTHWPQQVQCISEAGVAFCDEKWTKFAALVFAATHAQPANFESCSSGLFEDQQAIVAVMKFRASCIIELTEYVGCGSARVSKDDFFASVEKMRSIHNQGHELALADCLLQPSHYREGWDAMLATSKRNRPLHHSRFPRPGWYTRRQDRHHRIWNCWPTALSSIL